MRTVAVDILTGFLGSGKTTLLRHVLAHGLQGKPVAVIMNEIGEVGIDGKVVTGLANVEKMVELTSGCICCSIDDYRFDLAIQEIVETARPHLVIIESTGLADPEPLAYRVKNAGLGLDAVITVVDAANVDRELRETAVARMQIEAADFLVVNKTDLVDGARALRRRRLPRPLQLHMRPARAHLDPARRGRRREPGRVHRTRARAASRAHRGRARCLRSRRREEDGPCLTAAPRSPRRSR